MILSLPSASTFSGDIDGLVVLVTLLTGVWFIATQIMFFWLLWRFRAGNSPKSQYITGKEPHLKRWINIPHTLILLCDVVIIVAAVRVWVKVKQTLPPPDDTVRVVGQQWTWTFQHSGSDGTLDTADDVWTSDTLHVAEGKTYHFLLESKDVLHSFFVPVFRLKQDAIPGRTITGWLRRPRQARTTSCAPRILRHRSRHHGRAHRHRFARAACVLGAAALRSGRAAAAPTDTTAAASAVTSN